MTAQNNNNYTPSQWFQLVPEAVYYLANKVSALKEEEGEGEGENDNRNQITIKGIISKDLDENAQRIEQIARDFPELIGGNVQYEKTLDYIDSKKNIIRFALSVYAKDLRDSKKAIREKLETIRGSSNDSFSNDKAFFFKEFCKTENVDKLLANIREFEEHDYGRKPRKGKTTNP
jgi:peroxiredoxin